MEHHGLLSTFQCGFRRHRSTTDHLVHLETAIQDAFRHHEHLVAIFFDLEKAYDTTWRYGILRQLHAWGVRGHLGLFLQNFLRDSLFRVKVGSTLSVPFSQANGVPQGSVLSVTLFAVAVNSVMPFCPWPVVC